MIQPVPRAKNMQSVTSTGKEMPAKSQFTRWVVLSKRQHKSHSAMIGMSSFQLFHLMNPRKVVFCSRWPSEKHAWWLNQSSFLDLHKNDLQRWATRSASFVSDQVCWTGFSISWGKIKCNLRLKTFSQFLILWALMNFHDVSNCY